MTTQTPRPTDSGYNIVIGDNGFVWLARSIERTETSLLMASARQIRRWGTSRGLHQLAVEGAQKETILDEAANVELLNGKLNAIIPCEPDAKFDK